MTSYLSYKAPIRQEGFHMPHQPPSPPSSTPGASGSSAPGFDMFALPDAFRKFPGFDGAGHSMDFGDELANIMGTAPSSQQQQQQQHAHDHHHGHHHRASSSYDDTYRQHTHNIFDISAPIPINNHPALQPSQSQLPTPSSSAPTGNGHMAFGAGAPASAFSLKHDMHGLSGGAHGHGHGHGGPLHSAAGPLAEFNAHFNSTLPALNSSMRFDPNPPPPPPPQHAAHEPPLPPSAFALNPDYGQMRQQHTPSPVGVHGVSRSRSCSRAPNGRAPSAGPGQGPGPTRTQSTTRAKRNSISTTSPPPRVHPTSIIIPGAMPQLHRNNSLSTRSATDVGASPLSLGSAAGGWFGVPTPTHQAHPEFSLPTPDSISSHAHFNLGGRDGSLGHDGRDSSPSSVTGNINDATAKQVAIANEKRRRRRESHNAVERRRRDNINEKISELATLIPECMLDPNAPANFMPSEDQITGQEPMPAKREDVDPTPTPTNGASEAPTTPTGAVPSSAVDSAAGKANKGIILRKSVDYIRYLQQLVGAQASRNRELESALARYRTDAGEPGALAVGEDDLASMTLHNEIDMSAFIGDFAFGAPSAFGYGPLASVHETPMEIIDDDEDDDIDRPSTAMTNLSSLASPSVTGSGGTPGSMDDDDDLLPDHSEEQERGRRGRDGRVPEPIRVKQEGEA